ncbi:MAG: DUF751 family protein [Microcoleaceae cyanobacterium MO_207.B10]|nr:DUF751 family protein [Microcoleaceae cyanobacterium MO_207.B10]
MQDFLDKVSQYPRFLISITLGVFFFVFDKFKPLLNKPVTAIALIGLVMGTFVFLSLTLRAMLGLSPT